MDRLTVSMNLLSNPSKTLISEVLPPFVQSLLQRFKLLYVFEVVDVNLRLPGMQALLCVLLTIGHR